MYVTVYFLFNRIIYNFEESIWLIFICDQALGLIMPVEPRERVMVGGVGVVVTPPTSPLPKTFPMVASTSWAVGEVAGVQGVVWAAVEEAWPLLRSMVHLLWTEGLI